MLSMDCSYLNLISLSELPMINEIFLFCRDYNGHSISPKDASVLLQTRRKVTIVVMNLKGDMCNYSSQYLTNYDNNSMG